MDCVYAKIIYTGKSIVKDSHLVFKDNKIVKISKTKKGSLAGSFDVLTPAFIDPHSHIGMVRSGEPSSEEESNENMESIITNADALDSIQMDDDAFKGAVEMGVLYSCVLPGSGNIIAGQAAVIRNYATNSSDALMARAGIKGAFGFNPMSTQDWKGQRPCTRMGALSILRSKLDEIKQKIDKLKTAKGKEKKEITFSADEEVLKDLLEGKDILRVHAHKIDDIAALLRVAEEFKLKVSVEHAMDVHQADIFERLKKSNIFVTYGPMDSFPYKVELKHENWRNIMHLINSGVNFGLMTDHPVIPAGNLFMQTRWFLRAGFSKQQAVELVSRKNAEILGLNKTLGTLEKSKWASFICWNGDPFDMSSYPVKVYGEGKTLFDDAKR